MTTNRVHFAGPSRIDSRGIADGTACRPDGEHERELHATSDPAAVTCRACQRAIA